MFILGFYSASDKHFLLFPLSYDLVSFLLFLQAVAVPHHPFLCSCGTSCYFLLSLLFFFFFMYLQSHHLILPAFSPAANLFQSIPLLHFLCCWRLFSISSNLKTPSIYSAAQGPPGLDHSLEHHSRLRKKRWPVILSSSSPFFRSSSVLHHCHLICLVPALKKKTSKYLVLSGTMGYRI